jgi:hypothetical protein
MDKDALPPHQLEALVVTSASIQLPVIERKAKDLIILVGWPGSGKVCNIVVMCSYEKLISHVFFIHNKNTSLLLRKSTLSMLNRILMFGSIETHLLRKINV